MPVAEQGKKRKRSKGTDYDEEAIRSKAEDYNSEGRGVDTGNDIRSHREEEGISRMTGSLRHPVGFEVKLEGRGEE